MSTTSNVQSPNHEIPVIDYEGSGYKEEFWEGQGRDYEDAVERIALEQLLPAHGLRIAELGAGFGRLANLYQGYEQIVLFDYSRTLLADAVNRWGNDERFVFVAGNLYQLPLATGVLDSLVMVRVMHHLAEVPLALAQIARVLHKQSVAVLEYANKRNLKAMVRWWGRRQSWSPFAPEPIEFVDLNFDFHPRWMNQRLTDAHLEVYRQLGVSHFRLPLLKKRVSAQRLAHLDKRLFQMGGHYPVAPSIFAQVRLSVPQPRVMAQTTGKDIAALFRCPDCRAERFELIEATKLHDQQLRCQQCHNVYSKHNGIWDFKQAIRP
ncbi:MAG: class I SAM-dependent methyltransferase [Caldilineaceae bacterium]